MDDSEAMKIALRLAEKGRGRVEPNPVVGCVIVKGDQVVGKGYHAVFGGPHAEVHAIRNAGRSANGAALYVTLEPCSTHGKTPPCTDAIKAAGIRRVVIAAPDPTQPSGARVLRRAGIEVVTGVLREEAQEQNAPFFKLKLLGLPYVTAKWASSLDGKIATRAGDSRWISCVESRRLVHRMRAKADAVMVGIGTVLADDPMLNVRMVRGRNPVRVVLDSRAKIPVESKIVRSARRVPAIIAVSGSAPARKVARLEKAGCEVMKLRSLKDGLDLRRLLRTLAMRGMTNVLVEGGGTLLAGLFARDLVDRAVVFVAPRIIGGRGAVSPVEGTGAALVSQALKARFIGVRRSGDDVMLEAKLHTAADFLGHRAGGHV